MSKADGVFIYIGTYASEVDARTDYDLVKGLHSQGAVGTYDAAVITKDDDGKVHVNKDETSPATAHGAAPVWERSSESSSRRRSSGPPSSVPPSEA